MNTATLLTIAAAGIAVLLVLVIKVKLQPFEALVVVRLGVELALRGGGALVASHINDSGFWMFTKLVGLEVSDGLRTWSVLTTAMGALGFVLAAVVCQLV